MNAFLSALSSWNLQAFDAACFSAMCIGLLMAMMLAGARLFFGPSPFDRVLALNALGTKTVLFIALLGFLMGRPDFLDVALVYALINFISTIAILKYFRYRDLQAGEEDA